MANRDLLLWLQNLVGNVPNFENLSELEIKSLNEMMQRNKQKDLENNMLTENALQVAQAYNIEAKRLDFVNKSCGVSRESLSKSGSVSLNVLIQLAEVLELGLVSSER